jgi:hypothetical protein
MRKWLIALAAILLAVLAWFLSQKSGTETSKTAPFQKSTAQQDAAVAKALATANPKTVAIIASNFAAPAAQTIFYTAPSRPSVAPAGKSQPLEYTNLSPDIVLDSMRHAIRDYGSMFGGNPVGLNSEITSQLNGQNPRQVNFIRPEAGMRINDAGELVDPWGTPYFFHQLSGTDMEIHSAGPDKIMWTLDDLVVR